MVDFIDYLNSKNKVLYIFNGPDLEMSSEIEIKQWLVENGFGDLPENDEEDNFDALERLYMYGFSNFTFIDKTYGFFRSWMDFGVDEEIILTVLKYMLKKNIYDSRDIELGTLEELVDYEYFPKDDALFIPPDLKKDVLMEYNNCELVGGGENECLKEFEILLQLYDINYKINRQFVY